FGKYLKEIHITLAQLKKKWDEDTTLQDFDGAWNLQCVETASQCFLTPSKLEGDDVMISSDAVTVVDLKKPMEDLAGTMPRRVVKLLWCNPPHHADFNHDPYDDDMYEGQEIPDNVQSICDNLDIKVRGRKKE
ncbi:hypothetical protein Tco_0708039, partial [Tanacetum coccineum]